MQFQKFKVNEIIYTQINLERNKICSNEILICVFCELMHTEDLIKEPWGLKYIFLNIQAELEFLLTFPSTSYCHFGRQVKFRVCLSIE